MDMRPKNFFYGVQPKFQQPINGFSNFGNKQQLIFSSSPNKEQKPFIQTPQNYLPAQISIPNLQNKSIRRPEVLINDRIPSGSKVVPNSPLKIQNLAQSNRSNVVFSPDKSFKLQSNSPRTPPFVLQTPQTLPKAQLKQAQKPKDQQPAKSIKSSEQGDLSWTKFVSMELKIEQLEETIRGLKQQIKARQDKISQMETAKLYDKTMRIQQGEVIERRYQKILAEEKKRYDVDITKKKQQLDDVIAKIMDRTKKTVYHEVKTYVLQILNKNTELEVALRQEREKNIDIAAKLALLEGIQQESQEIRASRQQVLEKMVSELSMLTNKVLYKTNYHTESASYLQVIQVQANQITELRSNFECVQNEYLRTRDISNDTINKLKTSLSDQRIKFTVEKQEINTMLADLGFKLSNKQGQCNVLTRRLQALQRKYKEASQDYKSQIKSMQGFLKSNYKYLENSCVESVIKAMQVQNHCANCLKTAEEVERLNQKIKLLTD